MTEGAYKRNMFLDGIFLDGPRKGQPVPTLLNGDYQDVWCVHEEQQQEVAEDLI